MSEKEIFIIILYTFTLKSILQYISSSFVFPVVPVKLYSSIREQSLCVFCQKNLRKDVDNR